MAKTLHGEQLNAAIKNAVTVLKQGGVIAYPTEYCFGLGCDPHNSDAIKRILTIKQRSKDQGLILLAADQTQLESYVALEKSPYFEQIKASWPGPTTWVLPALPKVSAWVKGKHSSVAVRVTAHNVSQNLCQQHGDMIISTSANRHGQDELLTAADVVKTMGSEIDYVINADTGGASLPSHIFDGQSGIRIR